MRGFFSEVAQLIGVVLSGYYVGLFLGVGEVTALLGSTCGAGAFLLYRMGGICS
ncbi:MAG: hypothetical protein ACPGSW_06875 [Phaeobacter italicus]